MSELKRKICNSKTWRNKSRLISTSFLSSPRYASLRFHNFIITAIMDYRAAVTRMLLAVPRCSAVASPHAVHCALRGGGRRCRRVCITTQRGPAVRSSRGSFLEKTAAAAASLRENRKRKEQELLGEFLRCFCRKTGRFLKVVAHQSPGKGVQRCLTSYLKYDCRRWKRLWNVNVVARHHL